MSTFGSILKYCINSASTGDSISEVATIGSVLQGRFHCTAEATKYKAIPSQVLTVVVNPYTVSGFEYYCFSSKGIEKLSRVSI